MISFVSVLRVIKSCHLVCVINTTLLTKPTWTQITARRNLPQAMALFVSPVVPPVPPAPPASRLAVATQRVPSDAMGTQTLVRKRVADMTCGHEPKSWEIIDSNNLFDLWVIDMFRIV